MEYCDSAEVGAKFTLDDITQPSSKRLIRHLSGFINFFKFLEERRLKYRDMDEQTVELLEQADMVADDNEAMRERIAALRAKQADDMPKIEVCRERVAALESSIETKKIETAETKQTSGAAAIASRERSNHATTLAASLASTMRGSVATTGPPFAPSRMNVTALDVPSFSICSSSSAPCSTARSGRSRCFSYERTNDWWPASCAISSASPQALKAERRRPSVKRLSPISVCASNSVLKSMRFGGSRVSRESTWPASAGAPKTR